MNFWDVHGVLYLLFMALFPRLTMLFMGVCFMPFAGMLFWSGWVFMPRLTVAILATNSYWDTNTVLVVLTWLWALGGESTEKGAGTKALARRERDS